MVSETGARGQTVPSGRPGKAVWRAALRQSERKYGSEPCAYAGAPGGGNDKYTLPKAGVFPAGRGGAQREASAARAEGARGRRGK